MTEKNQQGWADKSLVYKLFWQLKNSIDNIVSSGIVTSVAAGNGIIVDNTNPQIPSVARLFYPSYDYNDLLTAVNNQTVTNGIYYLINRPNTGTHPMLVSVDGYTVAGLHILATKLSRGSFVVDTQVGATNGTLNVKVDAGTLNSSPIAWADTDPVDTIASNIVAGIDLAGYSAFSIGATVYLNNIDETNGGVVSVGTATGDALVTASVNNMADGGLFQWKLDGYNFLTDGTLATCTDTKRNVFNVDLSNTNLYDYFPADGASEGINIASGAESDFSDFVGLLTAVSASSNGSISAARSNAVIGRWNIISESTLDVTNITDGSTIEGVQVAVGKNTFTPKVATAGNEIITQETSNYAVTLTLTANAIDFNEDVYKAWAGDVSVSSNLSNLNTISAVDKAPKYFRLYNFAFDPTDIGNTNVFMTTELENFYTAVLGGPNIQLSGANSYAECVVKGTDVWITWTVDH